MFNLAQRHFRISLWGTEPANRSTYKESKREKEALFGAVATGLGRKLHSTAASACCFCQLGSVLFPVDSSVCTLDFFDTVKQPNGTIPLAHAFAV